VIKAEAVRPFPLRAVPIHANDRAAHTSPGARESALSGPTRWCALIHGSGG